MAQGQTNTLDAPDTLPPDFFDKKKQDGEAPDTLPGGFFEKKTQKSTETPPEQGALSRFNESLSTGLGAKPGFVDTLKSMGSGLKHMVTHRIDSASLLARGAADAQQEVIDKAYQEQKSPDFWKRATGYVRGAESAIPLVGPLLSKAGDEFSSGNVAGGLGSTAALAAPVVMGSPQARATTANVGKLGVKGLNAARSALAEKAVEPLVYENVGETAADRRMGVNPAKGITTEGHVGTKVGILEDAAARTKELKAAANNILQNHPNAGQWIDANPMIDQAVDDAIKEARKVAAPTERLEAVRKALKTEFGKVEGHPLEMNNLKSQIQEAAQQLGAYKNTQPVEASVAATMKNAARLIKEKVNSLVPEAADLNERMANSMDAQAGLQKGADAARGKSMFGGFHENILSRTLNRTLGSAPFRTAMARGLMTGLTEDVPPPIRATPFAPKGLLSPPNPATEAGFGQPDTSGTNRGQSGRWTTPAAQIPERPTITPKFLREIPRAAREAVQGAKAAQGPKGLFQAPPTTTIPPGVEDKFATEPTGRVTDETKLGPRGQGGIRIPIKGMLPAAREAMGTPPTPAPKPNYTPSEKASTMSGARKNLGPEFESGEVAHEIERNKSIIRNAKATAEDRAVARAKLRELQAQP